eukprot:365424-Chlamydomonas_euryale.AAC.30
MWAFAVDLTLWPGPCGEQSSSSSPLNGHSPTSSVVSRTWSPRQQVFGLYRLLPPCSLEPCGISRWWRHGMVVTQSGQP